MAQHVLGVLAGGDVGRDPANALRFSVGVAEREPEGDVRANAVALGGQLVELDGPILLQDEQIVGAIPIGLLAWEDVVVGLADDLLAAHLEELFEPAVDEHVAPLDVLGEDDGGRVVDDGLKQMLALAESGVRAGQLGRAFSHPLFQLLMSTLQLRVLFFELLLRLAQAQVRRDPRYHLSNLEWFGDVIDAPRLEPHELVSRIGKTGHEDHRDVSSAFSRFQAPASLETVDARHHHVQQDQVGSHEAGPLQSLFTVLSDEHLMTYAFQTIHQHAEIGGHVIHDQDSAGASTGCCGSAHGR